MLLSLNRLAVGSRQNSLFSFLVRFHTLPPAKYPSNPKFKSPILPNLHSLLDKCSNMKELKQVHAQIILNGLVQEIQTVGKLIAFCATSIAGDLHYGRFVFDRIAEPNKFMYNSLIRGYSNSNNPIEALFLYQQMMSGGLSPNQFTFPFVLKACAFELAFVDALVIHDHVIKLGFGSQVFVLNALLHVYAACGSIQYARNLFDDIPEKNLVSWNSMIGGYSRMGCCKEAFSLFRVMRDMGIEPDNFTLISLLSVCSQTGRFDLGRVIHFYIETKGVEIDLFVKNALVDMYAKCGDLVSAKTLFDRMQEKNVVSWTSMVGAYARYGRLDLARSKFNKMPEKNVVSWNSMISYYIQHELFSEAKDLFAQMQASNVLPDEATLVNVLTACSQIGDLVMGQKIHHYICNNNIKPSVTLWNSLIDMYAKCGLLDTASNLFIQMPERNVVSWNVMIGALAMHGRAVSAVYLFVRMESDSVSPDGITFVGLLCACSHGGLLDAGQYYFEAMNPVYGVPQEIEHYACMVDLLGRRGRLNEAVQLIGSMPMKPDVVVWGALLGACRVHGNVEIGGLVLKQLLELEPYIGGLYTLISNIYCEANRWEDSKSIRKLMMERGFRKCRAVSLIEVRGKVHEFLVDDKRHENSSNIYSLLDQLTDHMRLAGYLLNRSITSLDVDE
ncbi:hypothetical protein AAC387_Pa09g1953 [Persea americana]